MPNTRDTNSVTSRVQEGIDVLDANSRIDSAFLERAACISDGGDEGIAWNGIHQPITRAISEVTLNGTQHHNITQNDNTNANRPTRRRAARNAQDSPSNEVPQPEQNVENIPRRKYYTRKRRNFDLDCGKDLTNGILRFAGGYE